MGKQAQKLQQFYDVILITEMKSSPTREYWINLSKGPRGLCPVFSNRAVRIKLLVIFLLLTVTLTRAQPQASRRVAILFPASSYNSLRNAVHVLAEEDLWVRFDDLARDYIFHRNEKARLNRTCIREIERVSVNHVLQRNWAEMADIYTAIRNAILQAQQIGMQLSESPKPQLQKAGVGLRNCAKELLQLWQENLNDAQTAPSLGSYPFQRNRESLNDRKRQIILFFYGLEHWRFKIQKGVH